MAGSAIPSPDSDCLLKHEGCTPSQLYLIDINLTVHSLYIVSELNSCTLMQLLHIKKLAKHWVALIVKQPRDYNLNCYLEVCAGTKWLVLYVCMSAGQGQGHTVCPQQNVWHCKHRDGRLHWYVNRGRSLEKWYTCNQLMRVPAAAERLDYRPKYINFRLTKEPNTFWNYRRRQEHDGYRTAGGKSGWVKRGSDSSSTSPWFPSWCPWES